MSENSIVENKTELAKETDFELHDSSSGDVITYDEEERSGRFLRDKSWSDIFSIICAGAALISDGYQNNCMNMLNSVFAVEYPKAYTASVKTQVSNALLVGAVLGQLCVGLTCDYMGRKWAILTTTSMIVIGSILATASKGKTPNGMFWMLTVARGITGFGVGGEYPASSTSAAESANETTKKRGGVFVLVTNLPLCLGGPMALIVFLIVYAATGKGAHLTTTWRVMLGIGCIWPLAVFYFRWKMATSLLYKKAAIRRKVPYLLSIRFYWRKLIGTAVCWFIYDFVTFPNGIFSSTIISSVLSDSKDLQKVAEWNLLLSVLAIPGVFIGAYLVDRIGRKYTMCIGFGGYIVTGLIIGCAYEKISKIVPLFIIFYGIFNSCGNLGPGDVLGLSSAESYASPIRGTFYGFSAAFGKTGAAVGTEAFTPIQNNLGKKWTFIIAAICGAVGVTLSYLCVPHLLENDLMAEDIKYLRYVRAHGWTGSFGLDEDQREITGVAPNSEEEGETEVEDKN
ncbi:DEKNAAC102406 [Brettanomyces naardenensis]|uniref:DEKNAAC102406 n=1 Tax=Brettanomyces naardenensis TaxID=13370 RepID=A0A448YKY9_BRENA|nr:DEKNAAC102406 [Brettanomyces naardenensis]